MSTRSNIAIEDPKTKKVKVIYVHSDGYPYGVGKILNDNYTTYQKAKKLFNYGDASFTFLKGRVGMYQLKNILQLKMATTEELCFIIPSLSL
jgi:hypothetical protein